MHQPNSDVQPNRLYVYLIAGIAAVGGFIFGYDINVISPAMLFLAHKFELTPTQDGFARSSAIFACLAGPLVAYWLSDKLGRKPCLIIAGILFAISAVGSAIPNDIFMFNVYRIIGGVGVGLASVVSPMYIAEIAPARIRGRLVTVNQVAIVVGSTCAIVVCYFLIPDTIEVAVESSWRWMFLSELVPIAILLVGLIFIPRSPRWLAQVGRHDEAIRVLTKIDGAEHARVEIEEMERNVREDSASFTDMFKSGIRMALFIAVMVAIFQQWSGTSPLTFYAPEIFKKAGMAEAAMEAGNDPAPDAIATEAEAASGEEAAIAPLDASDLEMSRDAILNTVYMYVFVLFCVFIAFYLVDRAGRRPLLIVGTLGMSLGMFLLGYAFFSNTGGKGIVVAMYAAQFFYQISLAPVGWVVISEIFPTRFRAKGQSTAVILMWLSAGISTLYVGPAMSAMEARYGSPAAVFWFFATVCILACLFSWKFVPETKGRTLEEIGSMWNRP